MLPQEDNLNGKTIYLQCSRPDLGTRYALFSVGSDALKITYGNIDGHGLFEAKLHPDGQPFRETLVYSLFDEARLVHDGNGWNVSELGCWIKFLERQEL